MSAGIVFQQMVIVFLLIMTGYVAYKKEIIHGEVSRGISALVVNICNPAILIRSAFDRDPSVTNDRVLYAVLAGAVLYGVLLTAAFLLPRLLRVEEKWKAQYSLMCLFGNNGFIGIPLVSALFGDSALIYVAIANAYFNGLFYTLGIHLADGGKSKFRWKNFLNVGNFSIVLTIVLFLVQPPIPVIFRDTINHMANTTTFLAMVVIGISLARTDLKKIFSNRKLYVFIALRFLAVPVLVSLILRTFVTDPTVYGVMVLMASVPVANLPLMRVEETGGDGQMLSCGIILSTVLSLITIPIVVMFV